MSDRCQSRLHRACENGHFHNVVDLLSQFADPSAVDAEGWSPFGRAADKGEAEICRLFLKEKNVDANLKGLKGYTALHQAAYNGHTLAVKILLRHDANPHQKNDLGQSPIDLVRERLPEMPKKIMGQYNDILSLLNNPSTARKSRGSPQFDQDEKVMYKIKGTLQYAKVKKVPVQPGEMKYSICVSDTQDHIKVGESDLFELNMENQKKMTELRHKQNQDSGKEQNLSKLQSPVKYRKLDVIKPEKILVITDDQYFLPAIDQNIGFGSIKFKLTKKLHKQLIFECTKIEYKHLLKLPQSPNVEEILNDFMASNIKPNFAEKDFRGFLQLFDRSLGMYLLYRQERPQFAFIRSKAKNVRPSRIYGAQHLLRLFVKLPEILTASNMTDEHLEKSKAFVECLIQFLDEKSENLFNQNKYEEHSDEYLNLHDDV